MSKIKKLLTYLLGVTFAVVLALACVTLGVNNKANAAETADDFKVSSIGIRLQDNAVDTGVRFGVRIKSELLEKTGGIVQGMSGSPVLQNGKLFGAVTHVFVQDSTSGYGIFIENMMDVA